MRKSALSTGQDDYCGGVPTAAFPERVNRMGAMWRWALGFISDNLQDEARGLFEDPWSRLTKLETSGPANAILVLGRYRSTFVNP